MPWTWEWLTPLLAWQAVFLLCAGGLPLDSLLDEMRREQAQDIRERLPHHGARDVAWRGELATSATALVEQLLLTSA
jgi:hypothetical protein